MYEPFQPKYFDIEVYGPSGPRLLAGGPSCDGCESFARRDTIAAPLIHMYILVGVQAETCKLDKQRPLLQRHLLGDHPVAT